MKKLHFAEFAASTRNLSPRSLLGLQIILANWILIVCFCWEIAFYSYQMARSPCSLSPVLGQPQKCQVKGKLLGMALEFCSLCSLRSRGEWGTVGLFQRFFSSLKSLKMWKIQSRRDKMWSWGCWVLFDCSAPSEGREGAGCGSHESSCICHWPFLSWCCLCLTFPAAKWSNLIFPSSPSAWSRDFHWTSEDVGQKSLSLSFSFSLEQRFPWDKGKEMLDRNLCPILLPLSGAEIFTGQREGDVRQKSFSPFSPSVWSRDFHGTKAGRSCWTLSHVLKCLIHPVCVDSCVGLKRSAHIAGISVSFLLSKWAGARLERGKNCHQNPCGSSWQNHCVLVNFFCFFQLKFQISLYFNQFMIFLWLIEQLLCFCLNLPLSSGLVRKWIIMPWLF